jgi:tetraacyldisaccharide 4'-kinase
VPVISVGNLSVGGTGKSLVATELARRALVLGFRPAIVARGYGGPVPAGPPAARLGDEALEQLEALGGVVPVYCDPVRARAAARAAAAGIDLVILDDGFQHRQLHRNLDLVCIDALAPPEHDRLLPRGLLREPLTAVRRAAAVVLTRCDLAAGQALAALEASLREAGFEGPCLRSVHAPVRLDSLAGTGHRPPASLAGQPVVLVSGIGNPLAFERTVAALGARIVGHLARPDHHRWCPRDVAQAEGLARESGGEMVATGKDAVKLSPLLAGGPWWVLRVGLQIIAGEDDLERLLLGQRSTQPSIPSNQPETDTHPRSR